MEQDGARLASLAKTFAGSADDLVAFDEPFISEPADEQTAQ
jgi:hypothetical protein